MIDELKKDIDGILQGDLLDTLLFYFYEYPNEREEFSQELIKSFNKMVNEVLKEIKEEEREEI